MRRQARGYDVTIRLRSRSQPFFLLGFVSLRLRTYIYIIEALTITCTMLGAPYQNYGMMGPKTGYPATSSPVELAILMHTFGGLKLQPLPDEGRRSFRSVLL